MNRELIFIRHGATHLNSTDSAVDRIRGWRDVPLTKVGRQEAEEVAHLLENDPPDVIVTSDLERARETAEIISQILDVPIKWITTKFRPWNTGIYTGKPSADAVPVLLKLVSESPDEKIPEGESFNDFSKRFFSGLSTALSRFSGTVGIVSHYRGERLLDAWIEQGCPKDHSIFLPEFAEKGFKTGNVRYITITNKMIRNL